jgi:hypothetical protein
VKALVKAAVGGVLQSTEAVARVPVNACYHYRGARYGGFGHHPYEDYQLGLVRGDDRAVLRRRFAEIVLTSRPRTMDEVLGLDLGGWPIWQYPWTPAPRHAAAPLTDPRDNPDVVCHWCEGGVLASHVNREFGWLETALQSLRTQGYLTEKYGHVRCLELRADDHSTYLVLDGNHRLGAWFALGHSHITVKLARQPKVRREEVERWPRVRDGSLDATRALRIFDRYTAASNPPLTPLNPGHLVADEPLQWAPMP